MTRIIDKDEALNLLELAVADRGADYVYPAEDLVVYYGGLRILRKKLTPEQLKAVDINPDDPTDRRGSCVYYDDTEPLCIVGVVFNQVGITDKHLGYTGEQYGTVSRVLRYGDKEIAGVQFTPDAVGVLSTAQRIQDSGNPWGQALIAAKARARE